MRSMATTQAAVLERTGEPLCLCELELPPLEAGQVLVDIEFSGVCHTQLQECRGLRGPDRFLPHTLGHEGAGVVREVGAGVTKVAPGDPVVLTWIQGEGANVPSTRYRRAGGEVNSGAISTFLRAAVVSENRLVAIDPRMPRREAALLGCAIPTGGGIVLNTLGLRPDAMHDGSVASAGGNPKPRASMSLAVFGTGGIGLSAVHLASLVGVGQVIAIDIAAARLEQARELGATHAIDASSDDVAAMLLELTGGQGLDFAIESAGRTETMELAYRSVRNGGGLCVVAGNPPHGGRISIDPFDLIRKKRITGTWGGETKPDRDIPLYVDLYLAGRLRLDRLLTHTYSLERIDEALGDLEQHRVGRALIDMAGRD